MDGGTVLQLPCSSPTLRISSPAKVLVADGDAASLLAAGEALRTEGLDVVLADSGETVLRQMLQGGFEAVCLSARGPRVNGYEIAALIRGRERSAQVPIVFLMEAGEEPSPGLSRVPAVDYVAKPIEPDALRAKVGLLVELYRRGTRAARQVKEQPTLEGRDGTGPTDEVLAIRGCWSVAPYTASLATAPRRLLFLNDSVQRVVGFGAERFAAQADLWEANLHPDDRGHVLDALDRITETGHASLEYRFRDAAGVERCILDQCLLEHNADGEPAGVVGLWADATEERRREASLLRASKLEAIGRLAGGVAHDFNNMLAVAIGSLELLRTCIGDSEARNRAETAIAAARSCADLTQRLQALSRHPSSASGRTDLRAVVPETVDMIRPVLGERIDIRLDIPEQIRPVSVGRAKLEAVLLNLAASAREAMPTGGRLTIKVLDAADAAAHPGVDGVEIVVSDTGRDGSGEPGAHEGRPSGADAAVHPGLRQIMDVMQRSGGDVRIERAAGGGRTVRVLLPG